MSIAKKQKQKLWEKLRKLDRKISLLPKQILMRFEDKQLCLEIDRNSKLYKKLDAERKEIRRQLKQIHPPIGERHLP